MRKRGKYGRDWIEEELTYLKDNYKKKKVFELCNHLERSRDSVAKKMSRLGLSLVGWKINELKFIKDNYKVMTNKEMAQKLKRSTDGVSHKLSDLKLIKSFEEISKIFRRIPKNYATGKRSPLWHGGVTKEDKLFYSKRYWRNKREEIISKSSVCKICLTNEDLIIHHKKFRRDGGKEEKKNLVILCRRCHSKIHTLERFYRNNHVIKDFEELFNQVKRKLDKK